MAVEEGQALSVIVDTNVLVAALLQAGIVRELILGHPHSFVTPDACVAELWDHREEWNRRGLSEGILGEAIDLLTEYFVSTIPRPAYQEKEGEARSLIRDPDDVPVVALALALDNRGVWTFNTKDFSGPRLLARIRVLTTSEVKAILTTP